MLRCSLFTHEFLMYDRRIVGVRKLLMDASDRETLQKFVSDEAKARQLVTYVEGMLERQAERHEDEKRYLTDRLLRAENLARIKAELLATLNLEARTPLTTVIILCDVLRRHRERLSDQRHSEAIDQIQAQVERLGGLLNQLGGMALVGD